MTYLEILIAALVGFTLGALIFWLLGRQKRIEETASHNLERNKLESLLDQQKGQLEVLDEAKKELSSQFQLLANNIFEEKSEKFKTQNREALQSLLNPLKEDLTQFKTQISNNREKDIRDRTNLLNQLASIQTTGLQMSSDAANLVNALKGESHVQGAWGEMILKTALDASGLEEGREYSVQHSGKSEDGRRLRPDVLVHLPGGGAIILDSKVSLTAYERSASLENEGEREAALKEHKTSVQNHIKNLSSKDYTQLLGVQTLDFVLMFIPIEGAFSAAVRAHEGKNSLLIEDALNKGVVIVTPTTLMIALKTISQMWRIERQNINAYEIADRGGKLYDKFKAFLDDVVEIGKKIENVKSAQEAAINKLATGRGNLVSQAEQLKKLGAKVSKQIPQDLSERAVSEDRGIDFEALTPPKEKSR
ncbi:MAG: DNA recombination protein RmuC [Magnetovibrio sp.]|nr:DNA recombination protein RmuC [Magnetovibrio sp.]|tara:strand:+ start:1994 stop:3256 length:1263 start_codon:yes stop_codon:yes gene_type:complete